MTRPDRGTRVCAQSRQGRPPADASAEMLSIVRQAVETGSVTLAFQPVMQAADADRAAFHEGLIRVLDSAGRVIPAALFIDAVEGSELGRQIDCLALALGLKALQSDSALRLAINISARTIGHVGWLRTLEAGLAGCDTVAERLILEITETAAMGCPETVTGFMRGLQRRGVAFALDDFGAGVTSFRYLRQFRFDIVKIDGQFVKGIAADRDSRVLVGALVAIARHFDMVTVAERVETAADAAACVELGVSCLQGYHFGAPALHPEWIGALRLTA